MTNTNNSGNRALLQKIARNAMLDKGFLIDFPSQAIDALNTMQEKKPMIAEPVRDLKNLSWCSIDNDDSEDLDQLSVAIGMPSGEVKILVAIADVDSVADKNSMFEDHARHNSTSVYTSAQIFPMLPEKLSTDLTSLKYDADRSAIVVEFVVADDGSMKDSLIYPAIVHNKAKLAYNSLSAWLDGNAKIPQEVARVNGLDENLRLQYGAAKKLKILRYSCGALNLETIEARPVFRGDEVSGLNEERMNEAKDIIQEFMICANSITARFLSSANSPSIRRVVREPKRWDRIVELASGWKLSLPAQPDSKALDEFLLSAKSTDPLRFPDLSLSVIKLLGAGEYVVELPGEKSAGHFGLAIKDYTHSTAPNRRYPDLITQRLLKSVLYKTPVPYSTTDLAGLASHCTTMEDGAKKVERQVEKSTAALLLGGSIGRQYDGIITGVSDKGTWVRILHPPVEGKIVSGFEGLDVGNRVRVQLLHTDINRGFIDFKHVNT
ncbi:MAG: RNB domain-containing ribonuclease [Bacteroidota bacterium]|nr:RNB domain-containing ribonuclease [Bacteroidota bacterium]